MRRKITVIGSSEASRSLAAALGEGDIADVVTVNEGDDLARSSGSDIVVLSDGSEVAQAGREVTRYAPGAVVLVATADAEGDCAVALEATLLPRGRVLGLPGADGAQVRAAAQAVLFDRCAT